MIFFKFEKFSISDNPKTNTMFTPEDLDLLKQKGISAQQIEEQLHCFETGFPYLKLEAPAGLGNGILSLDDTAVDHYLEVWEEYLTTNPAIVKFVPASGAASRMFKNLFEFVDADYTEPTTDFEKKFFGHIHNFAFFADLNAACLKNEGKDIDALMAAGCYKAVVENLLLEKGLNYGALPKGMLKFHHYPETDRTAMEEHLAEGAMYARNEAGDVNVHFTVSHEHLPYFKQVVADKQAAINAMTEITNGGYTSGAENYLLSLRGAYGSNFKNAIHTYYRWEDVTMASYNPRVGESNRLEDYASNVAPYSYYVMPTDDARARFDTTYIANSDQQYRDNRGSGRTFSEATPGQYVLTKWINGSSQTSATIIAIYRASNLHLMLCEALSGVARFTTDETQRHALIEAALALINGGIGSYWNASTGAYAEDSCFDIL